MSQIGKDGISAEQKFWNTHPELVERLLIFLDASSTMHLAQAHRITLQRLQFKSVWLKLVKRSCPRGENRNWPIQEADVEKKRTLVGFLVGILKMFDVENSLQLELELLGVICTRFPVVSPYRPGPGEEFHNYYRGQQALVRCSYHNKTHLISPLGLLLQEDVERGLGTSEQKIERVWVYSLRQPLLASLSSRARRQKEPLALVDAIHLGLNDKGCADALSDLAKNCIHMNVEDLDVRGRIGTDGWVALAEALRSGVLFPWINCVSTLREALFEARVEDLRTIWNAKVPVPLAPLQGGLEGGPWETIDSISRYIVFLWKGPQEQFQEEFPWPLPLSPEDDGWEKLKQILDMSQDEFNTAQLVEDDEEEDDDEDIED